MRGPRVLAERIKHLALATLSDPGNAAARGLLGLVLYQGKWQRPDDVSRQAQDDPARQAILKEYLDRRPRTADKPDDQWRLALWCDQNGLKEQSTIHLRRVVALDPKREAAWKRLGFKKQGNQWVKPELAAGEKAENEAQHRANRSWKPKLERLAEALAARDKVKRTAAEEALGQITDPRGAHGLDGLRPGRSDAAARGSAGPQSDQCFRLLAGAGPPERVQPLARRPPVGGPDPPPARSPRFR